MLIPSVHRKGRQKFLGDDKAIQTFLLLIILWHEHGHNSYQEEGAFPRNPNHYLPVFNGAVFKYN